MEEMSRGRCEEIAEIKEWLCRNDYNSYGIKET